MGAYDPEAPNNLLCINVHKGLRKERMIMKACVQMSKEISWRHVSGINKQVQTAHVIRRPRNPSHTAMVFVAALWFARWYTPSLPHKYIQRYYFLHTPTCPCLNRYNQSVGGQLSNAGIRVLGVGMSKDRYNHPVTERLLIMEAGSRLILAQRSMAKLITWTGRELTMDCLRTMGDYLDHGIF